MSTDRLSSLLQSLEAENAAQLPIAEAVPRILELDAREAKKLKDTEDGNAIVAQLNSWYEACKSDRLPEERIWNKNIDMYQGRQFTIWDDNQRRMITPSAPETEIRIAVNIIEPTCRTEMAKTGSTHPGASVIPASSDMDDVMAALAGQQVWEWFYRVSGFQTRIFGPANFWRTICGNGFTKVYFDTGAIDDAATQAALRDWEAQQPDLLAAGLSTPKPKPSRGMIDGQGLSPYNVLVPDLAELDLQRQPYFIHHYTMPFEKAKYVYGTLLPEDWNPAKVQADAVIESAHLGITAGKVANANSVLIKEVYIKPGYSHYFPDGGYAILIDTEIVAISQEGLPYEHGQYPFQHFTGIETGRFYRKSIVQSITPLQDQLNRTYAQLIKHRNLMTKPQFFYDEGSVDPKRISSKAGQYIPIRLGMKYPQPVPIQEAPAFVLNLVDRFEKHRDDISGQHQISRAISPGADTAASALSILRETDDDFLTPTFDSIRTGLQSFAQQVLSLAVQYWDEQRLIKVTGDEAMGDAKLLAGADLKNGTDIWFDEESMLPQSRTAKVATITDWFEKGLIPGDAALEAMQAGQLGKVWQRLKLDRDAARRENIEIRNAPDQEIDAHYMQQDQAMQMAQMGQQVDGAFGGLPADPSLGLPPAPDNPMAAGPALGPDPMAAPAAPEEPFFPIGWMDNDEVHIAEHKAQAKSQDYKSWSPSKQRELEVHTKAHEARLAETQMQQTMMGAIGGGQPQGDPALEPGYAGGQDPVPAGV